ncbi:MAG: hypothetical protein CL910_12520 [Deltaproteobacteria bacterium]|jgi:hypothetical protein|nr:hypothetical protein [Deltaproteobacteria bacterium]
MSRNRTALAGGLLVLLVAACGCHPSSESGWRRAWAADWNARVDAHRRLRDHPCGDFAFDPWVDEFLGACERYTEGGGALSPGECEARSAWAWERSSQCATWQAWLLRNVHKHERVDSPEPETRVQ